MTFADIKGNGQAVEVLRSMADGERVPHAMLLYENPHSGGMALINAFLQYLFCEHRHDGDSCGSCPSCVQISKWIHPDVNVVFPVNSGGIIKGDHPVSEGGMQAFRELFASNPYFSETELYSALKIENKSGNISVYEAKNILSKLSQTSVSGSYKVVVMFLPEKMNIQAANKMLKIVEEPPEKTLFLMLTYSPEDVLTTIVSRCQGLRVLPADRSLFVPALPAENVRDIWKDMFTALIGRDLAAALECGERAAALPSRDLQKEFCVYASESLRKHFLNARGMEDIAYIKEELPCTDSRLPGSFYLQAVPLLDKAALHIGRNVSSRMVFADLVDRLFILKR